MIFYNTKKWSSPILLQLLIRKPNSHNSRTLMLALLLILVYNTLLTFLEIHLEILEVNIQPTFFSLIGIILSLTLVFRLNSAYDKWWEGRKIWGAMVNDCRTLASTMSALIPQDHEAERKYWAAQISNFPYAVKNHLRGIRETAEYTEAEEGYKNRLQSANHIPHTMVTLMYKRLEALFKAGLLCEADKRNVKEQLQRFMDELGGCERIKNTPIPFSHASFIKTFIFIYSLTLPLSLIPIFGYSTILASGFICYALTGLEIISEEIENPFGADVNDLPLMRISNTIKTNVYEALDVIPEGELPEDAINFARGMVIIQ